MRGVAVECRQRFLGAEPITSQGELQGEVKGETRRVPRSIHGRAVGWRAITLAGEPRQQQRAKEQVRVFRPKAAPCVIAKLGEHRRALDGMAWGRGEVQT